MSPFRKLLEFLSFPLPPSQPNTLSHNLEEAQNRHKARRLKWDMRMLGIAREVSTWSKDPSTKVGAVIMRPDETIASTGFNGFPRGMNDDERLRDRAKKYNMILHAEVNAILHAREDLTHYTLYTYPFPPCSNCAALIIQAGIGRVVSPPLPSDIADRWRDSVTTAATMFREGGVQLDYRSPHINRKTPCFPPSPITA